MLRPIAARLVRFSPFRWVGSGLILTICTLGLTSCESITSNHATVAEAREHGIFEQGWLPEIIPERATAITVVSNPDTNTCRGELTIDQPDIDPFLSKLSTQGQFDYAEQREAVRKLSDRDKRIGYHQTGKGLFAFSCVEAKCAFVCGPGN